MVRARGSDELPDPGQFSEFFTETASETVLVVVLAVVRSIPQKTTGSLRRA